MSTRPDYRRIRAFLSRGGVLQREVIPVGPVIRGPEGQPVSILHWHAAARDGRAFDVETCEWLSHLDLFTLNGALGWLEEGPPGIFKRVPDIHPTRDTHLSATARLNRRAGAKEGP